MATSDIEVKSKYLRNRLIEICGRIGNLQSEEGFPAADKEVLDVQHMLNDDNVEIIVCGEVKKGKSSLINAIIGDDVLPVDTRVATSQAFKIYNREQKAYYLVYNDGTKEEISAEGLKTFGSQAFIDENGEKVAVGKIVDYIEVHAPISFLPKEVVIVDTPGIGALYANHANITFRHLANALGAIFVMDPANPLTQTEIDFLEKVVKTTPYVITVMTKADNYDETFVESQCRRNEEILIEKGFAKTIGDSNGDIRVLPISSTLLASSTDNSADEPTREFLYNVSNFEKVKSRISDLIVTTAALAKNVNAYNLINSYNSDVVRVLEENTRLLSSPTCGGELLEEKKRLQKQFSQQWGPQGKEQAELINRINAIVHSFSNHAVSLFNPGSEIYNKLYNEIDSLGSYNDAKNYAANFSSRMVTEYGQAWKNLNDECIKRIQDEVANYGQSVSIVLHPKGTEIVQHELALKECEEPKFRLMDYFNNSRNAYFSGTFAAVVLTQIGVSIPIIGIVVGGLILLGSQKNQKLEKLRTSLKSGLTQNLTSLRDNVMIKPIDDKSVMSRLDTLKSQYIASGKSSIMSIFSSKEKKMKDEIAELTQKIETAQKERQKISGMTKAIREKWLPVHKMLSEAGKELDDIEKLIASSER